MWEQKAERQSEREEVSGAGGVLPLLYLLYSNKL